MSATDPEVIANWQRLTRAAQGYRSDDKASANELSEAAKAWAAARPAAPRPAAPSGLTIPFGRSKGKPLSEADDKDLRWVAGAVRKSLDDPAKERWRAKNAELLAAIDAELAGR
ncbi:MAG: hypothetical protein NTV51_03905 [Verrucomicrobia bacterium]|nr:hypothetical protein [Verrucomicrobiota bacterium]